MLTRGHFTAAPVVCAPGPRRPSAATRRRSWVCAAALALGGCAAPDVPSARLASASVRAPSEERPPADVAGADYLVVTPAGEEDVLRPLLDLRAQQGHHAHVLTYEALTASGDAGRELTRFIEAMRLDTRHHPTSEPRFVLLVGAGALGRARLGEWADGLGQAPSFPSDHAFERLEEPRVAVGRLPVRDRAELAGAVAKLVRYEADPPGSWQRRVLVFGGPADFGPLVDALIEGQAQHLLDDLLPHAFDVGVLFAKATSPFAFRFDKLGEEIVRELNEGALIAVYAGHGSPMAFDHASYRDSFYPIGDREQLRGVRIEGGAPLFVSLTCSTGRFGDPVPSLGEELAVGAQGPVAVFASSDISHPYPNLLYGQALLDELLVRRRPTLGEGVLAAKSAMLEADVPLASMLVPGDVARIKRDHLELYNLLGDPATRLRLPAPLSVALPKTRFSAGEEIALDVAIAASDGALAVLRLETDRSVIKPGLTPPGRLDALPLEEAFRAMSKNHALALDKRVAEAQVEVRDGAAHFRVQAPSQVGRYWIKVHAPLGSRSEAAGAAEFTVEAGAPR